MAGKNNTTPIGDGSIGLDTKDAVGREIQREISENNLKYQMGQNSTVKGVFNATVRMVSRWQRGDKYRILQEYGAVEQVSKNPSDDELNQAVATSLIANLPKDELKRIIGSEEAKQNKLAKDVQLMNAKSLSLGKKYFNSGSANKLIKSSAGQISDPKQAIKLIKQEDKDYKLDKEYSKKYPALKKELVTLLKSMKKDEIARYAVKMELEFEDNSSFKKVSNLICTTVLMYVSLLVGKTKGISPSRFSPTEIDAIEELLLMTSWAWVTGKESIGSIEIANRRKKAAAAKKAFEANEAIAKASSKYIKVNKKGKTSLKKRILPNSKNRFLNKRISQNTSQLDNLSEEQIRDLARTKGVADADNGPIADVKSQLVAIMSSEDKALIDQQKKALKIKDPQKRKEAFEKIKNAKRSSVMGTAMKMTEQATQDYSDKIPVVTFNEKGKIASEGILKAVPVFVAGYADAVGKIQSKEEAKAVRDEDETDANNKIDQHYNTILGDLLATNNKTDLNRIMSMSEKIKNNQKDNSDLAVALRSVSSTDADYTQKVLQFLSEQTQDKPKTAEMAAHIDSMGVRHSVSSSMPSLLTPNAFKDIDYSGQMQSITEAQQKVEAALNDPLAQYHDFRTDPLASQYDVDKEDYENSKKSNTSGSAYTVSQLHGKVSELAEDMFGPAELKKKTQNGGKQVKVIPVLDLNKSHDYTGQILDYAAQSTAHLNSVVGYLDNLNYMWNSLQSAGLSMNLASAGGVMGIVNTVANIASDVAGGIFDGGRHMATGGHMKGQNRGFVSNIITGDHPQNKNNTELVSVDWANRNINVKPVPKMATGGSVKEDQISNVSNVHRLSSSERKKPLSVGIDTGLVRYSRALSDVQDDSTGTAIKVYTVNAGIHDKVKVGDGEMSLFDAVYGVYTSVAALSQEISTSNQLLNSISANTAATSSKISNLAQSSGSAPFEFTTELNTILSGE